MFFKAKPNVGDNDKAKIEFFFQQIARSLGNKRLSLPIIRLDRLMSFGSSDDPVKKLLEFLGQHLDHDYQSIGVRLTPEIVKKCGGGG
jgi:hypothetical protein